MWLGQRLRTLSRFSLRHSAFGLPPLPSAEGETGWGPRTRFLSAKLVTYSLNPRERKESDLRSNTHQSNHHCHSGDSRARPGTCHNTFTAKHCRDRVVFRSATRLRVAGVNKSGVPTGFRCLSPLPLRRELSNHPPRASSPSAFSLYSSSFSFQTRKYDVDRCGF